MSAITVSNCPLSNAASALRFGRMGNIAIEADIENGKVIPREPEKLPVTGKALITVLPTQTKKPDINVINSVIGTLKTDIDAAEWQRQERDAWEDRIRKQWGER